MSKQKRKIRLLDRKNFIHDFIRVTGAPIALWYRPKLIYTSKKAKEKICGGALLIANHTDMCDPVYMMLGVPYRRQFFIISEEVMDKPVGKLFRACRCIRIDRHNPQLETFREIIARLKSGELISMFPEGQISRHDGMAPFHSGMVLMAVRSGVPIVPMYIRPKSKLTERLKIVIGECVCVTELYGKQPTFVQIDAATKLLYERERELESFIG